MLPGVQDAREECGGGAAGAGGVAPALQTDHLDLYQLHAFTTLEDVNQAFAPGGAMESF